MLSFLDFLLEGNPLARVKKMEDKGRPSAGITAWRGNLSKAENKERMKEFDKDLKKKRYGFRKTKGKWEGGEEESRYVTAHGKGNRHKKQFRRDMERLSTEYGQDAVAHRHDKTTDLIGTNDTGYPGRGKVVNVGKTVYNKKDADFQTEFNPRKPGKHRPSFTTKGD